MERLPAARLLLFFCSLSCAYAQFNGVLTYHNNNQRTGLNSAETTLTLSNVNVHTFGVLRPPILLDGEVHAQVLHVPNLTVNGAIHNVIYVVTEHDTVYAFDANGKQPSSTQPWLWKRTCLVVHGSACGGTPAANVTSVPCTDFIGCSSPGFETGITATPVISVSGNAIYVVAETKETTPFNLGPNCLAVSGTSQFHCYYFALHALNLNNGAEKPGSPVLIHYPGSSTLPRFNPFTQTGRAGLLLANGNVYVAFGSRGDIHPYHGWIFAFKATTLAPGTPTPFVSTPATQTEACPVGLPAITDAGGIWSVGALAADSAGNLFVSTGQGTFNGSSNFADSFLKLSGTTLAVLDFFTPFNENMLACNDWDAGSGSPMLLPLSAGSPTIPNVMIVGTKEGIMSANKVMGRLYLINRDNMGKHTTTTDHVLKELIGTLVNPYNPYLLFNAPAYWNHHIYVGPSSPAFSFKAVPVSLLAFSAFSASISSTPISRSAADFVYAGANPSVSANGISNGIVWALSHGYTNPVTNVSVHPALRAFNASNLASELYNSSMNSADALAGDVTTFTLPTIANGKVYATVHYATTSFPKAKLYFFGLLPKPR